MNSINKNARMAGFLYLIYMVTHIISDVWRDSFMVHGDAAATVSNIMAHEGLFTGTVVGDLLAAALFFWPPGRSTFYSNRLIRTLLSCSCY